MKSDQSVVWFKMTMKIDEATFSLFEKCAIVCDLMFR